MRNFAMLLLLIVLGWNLTGCEDKDRASSCSDGGCECTRDRDCGATGFCRDGWCVEATTHTPDAGSASPSSALAKDGGAASTPITVEIGVVRQPIIYAAIVVGEIGRDLVVSEGQSDEDGVLFASAAGIDQTRDSGVYEVIWGRLVLGG